MFTKFANANNEALLARYQDTRFFIYFFFGRRKHLSTLSNSLILNQSWRAERFHSKSLLSSRLTECVTVAERSSALTDNCEGWERL